MKGTLDVEKLLETAVAEAAVVADVGATVAAVVDFVGRQIVRLDAGVLSRVDLGRAVLVTVRQHRRAAPLHRLQHPLRLTRQVGVN